MWECILKAACFPSLSGVYCKRDIRKLHPDEAQVRLRTLSPVHFCYRDEEKMQLGFIAEADKITLCRNDEDYGIY